MKKCSVLSVVVVCLSVAVSAEASVIFTFNSPTTGTVSLDQKALKTAHNLIELGDSASVFWDASSLLGKTRHVDGFKMLEVGGDFVFSFAGAALKYNGTTFTQNDLIRYDSAAGTYAKFWTPPTLAAGANLGAFMLPNGDANEVIFTVLNTARVNGKVYGNRQLFDWTAAGGYVAYQDPWLHGGPGRVAGMALDGQGDLLVSGTTSRTAGHNTQDIYQFSSTNNKWVPAIDIRSSLDAPVAGCVGDFDVTDRFGSVPEPATLGLLALGGLAVVAMRRRKR